MVGAPSSGWRWLGAAFVNAFAVEFGKSPIRLTDAKSIDASRLNATHRTICGERRIREDHRGVSCLKGIRRSRREAAIRSSLAPRKDPLRIADVWLSDPGWRSVRDASPIELLRTHSRRRMGTP
ncbi:MAG: hypothetical protein ABSB97_05175, partial [Thermoplasmata archaeon]